MILEWSIAGVLLLLALAPVALRWRSPMAWAAVIAVAAMAGLGMWRWHVRLKLKEISESALRSKTPREGRPGGYVTSDSCRSCHPQQHDSWRGSFHRTMTQHATDDSVRGDFNDVALRFDGKAYQLKRRAGEYWCEMVDPDWEYVEVLKRRSRGEPGPIPLALYAVAPRAEKRVGMLTGSHFMQAYWVASEFGNMQFSLPFTYVFEMQRWVPRNDVFLIDPARPWVPDVWNVNCILCHATAGQPRQDAKTAVIDSRTAELGIACEACHGPAAEHVRANAEPKRRYQLHYSHKPDATIFNPARADHVKSSETCGQCHAIRAKARPAEWQQEGFPFRPGGEIETCAPLNFYDAASLSAPHGDARRRLSEGSYWSDGMVRVSGREFNGMAGSACYKKGGLSCLSCHSMHQYLSKDDQLAPHRKGNESCLQCHSTIGAKLEAHTHHSASSSGSLCYNCHMPHTTYGLLKAIRSHWIDSPSVQSSLDTGRPNACNLCHLDRSLGWTARQLNEWFSKPLPVLTPEQQETSAAATWILAGDAGQRALLAWHFGWGPAVKTSGHDWLAPWLAELLQDPYSVVRHISSRSLRRLPGFENFSYDYVGPEPERARARDRALGIWRAQVRTNATARPSLLLDASGALQQEKLSTLLRRRDNRSLELLE
jgi:hypothetical protein